MLRATLTNFAQLKKTGCPVTDPGELAVMTATVITETKMLAVDSMSTDMLSKDERARREEVRVLLRAPRRNALLEARSELRGSECARREWPNRTLQNAHGPLNSKLDAERSGLHYKRKYFSPRGRPWRDAGPAPPRGSSGPTIARLVCSGGQATASGRPPPTHAQAPCAG